MTAYRLDHVHYSPRSIFWFYTIIVTRFSILSSILYGGYKHTRRVLLIEYFNDKIASLPLLARRLILVDFGPDGQQRPSQANPSVRRHTWYIVVVMHPHCYQMGLHRSWRSYSQSEDQPLIIHLYCYGSCIDIRHSSIPCGAPTLVVILWEVFVINHVTLALYSYS